jgi:chromosome segregation ATPase
MANERTRLAELDGGGRAKRLQEQEQLKNKLDELRHVEQDTSQRSDTLAQKVLDAEAQVNQILPSMDAKKEEVEGCTRAIHDLQQKKPQGWEVFGRGVQQVADAVTRESRFHETPVGPVGKYVRLLHPEWSGILERMLAGFTSAFVVTDKHDQNLLSDTMRKYNW